MQDGTEGQAPRSGCPTLSGPFGLGAALLQGLSDLTACTLVVVDSDLRVHLATAGPAHATVTLAAAPAESPGEAPALRPELAEFARATLATGEPRETTLLFGEDEWSVRALPLAAEGHPAILLALQPFAGASSGTDLTALRAEALDAIASGVIIVHARMPACRTVR